VCWPWPDLQPRAHGSLERRRQCRWALAADVAMKIKRMHLNAAVCGQLLAMFDGRYAACVSGDHITKIDGRYAPLVDGRYKAR